jgi:hypothetical protein
VGLAHLKDSTCTQRHKTQKASSHTGWNSNPRLQNPGALDQGEYRSKVNCVEQSPSWEANRSSASHEIPRILWNPKIHYCIEKRPPPVPNLSIGVYETRSNVVTVKSITKCVHSWKRDCTEHYNYYIPPPSVASDLNKRNPSEQYLEQACKSKAVALLGHKFCFKMGLSKIRYVKGLRNL